MNPPTARHGATVYHGNARFTVISPVCIRLEYHPDRRFIDAPSLFAANRQAPDQAFTVEPMGKHGKQIAIRTEKMELRFKAGNMPFCGGNLSCRFTHGADEVTWAPEMRNSHNLGGTLDSLDGRHGPVNLGEGLLSRDGWYCIDDSANHLLVDDWVQPRPDDAGTDWYLFAYGADYEAALQALTAVGGPVPLPRKILLGSWYSRWHAYTSQQYRELVDEYDQHGYPLDILVWDMDWHRMDAEHGFGWAFTKGWTGFSWNRQLLPDAEQLIAEMHDRGVAVTLNVHPHDGIRPFEDMYEQFMRELGRDPQTDPVPLFDAGDRAYMNAYFKHAHTPKEEAGVDFWWVDWQQDVLIPTVPGVPGLRHQPWLNELYFRQTARNNRRGVNFSRWAGWGDHRHPIHFTGDAHASWNMLAFQVPYTTTAGNVGCFFASHDMGGFTGCEDAELYTRWLQFGALSAAMRLHGLGHDRRPWTWDQWAQPAMHKAFEWRSRLMPYIYTAVARSCRDTVPLLRAMYHAWPQRDAAYRNPQQFLFGDAMLAAPIVTPGNGPGRVGRQVVWLPEGTWFNWFTGERFHGPAEVLVCAALEETPLFVRAGLPIPMQPFRLRPTTAPLTQLVIRCFPGHAGQSMLYEDDGETRDYKQGLAAETTLQYRRHGDQITITIDPARGSYPNMPQQRDIRLELPNTRDPRHVRINGRPADCSYDEASATTRIDAPRRSVAEGAVITLNAREIDANDRHAAALKQRRKHLGEAADPQTTMALRGVGLAWKNENLYRDGPGPVLKLYAPAGLLDDDRVALELTAGDLPPASIDYRGQAGFPFAVPIPERFRDQSIHIRFQARIDGEDVAFTTPGFAV